MLFVVWNLQVTEGHPDNNPGEQTPVADPMETESMDAAEPGDTDAVEPGDQNGAEPEDAEPATDDSMRLHEIREMFGENCIAEQTYEVELSEYDGKVWMPYILAISIMMAVLISC